MNIDARGVNMIRLVSDRFAVMVFWQNYGLLQTFSSADNDASNGLHLKTKSSSAEKEPNLFQGRTDAKDTPLHNLTSVFNVRRAQDGTAMFQLKQCF